SGPSPLFCILSPHSRRMAADNSAPWSRWDAPGFQYVATNTQPTVQRVFDVNGVNNGFNNNGFNNGFNNANGFPGANNGFPNGLQRDTSQNGFFVRSMLIDQRINSLDPSFYDCVYSVANSASTVIEQCYKDIGCCASTCCPNDAWRDKYGWAVALIVIFCILMLIALFATLFCWLFNRSADKNQKKELLTNAGLSPAPSQLSLAPPPPAAAYNPGYGSPGGYHY
ncbi:hypothetical protein PMAYCL1PPCAC_31552, partial [Pristionchus mayeri]